MDQYPSHRRHFQINLQTLFWLMLVVAAFFAGVITGDKATRRVRQEAYAARQAAQAAEQEARAAEARARESVKALDQRVDRQRIIQEMQKMIDHKRRAVRESPVNPE